MEGAARDFEPVFRNALTAVKERRTLLLNTAPAFILSKFQELRIDEFVQALEEVNIAPFDIKKAFLADLAVVVTRVWEAYTIDGDGKFFVRNVAFIHVDNNFGQEIQFFLFGTWNLSRKMLFYR